MKVNLLALLILLIDRCEGAPIVILSVSGGVARATIIKAPSPPPMSPISKLENVVFFFFFDLVPNADQGLLSLISLVSLASLASFEDLLLVVAAVLMLPKSHELPPVFQLLPKLPKPKSLFDLVHVPNWGALSSIRIS